jgi:hypothetical protein
VTHASLTAQGRLRALEVRSWMGQYGQYFCWWIAMDVGMMSESRVTKPGVLQIILQIGLGLSIQTELSGMWVVRNSHPFNVIRTTGLSSRVLHPRHVVPVGAASAGARLWLRPGTQGTQGTQDTRGTQDTQGTLFSSN